MNFKVGDRVTGIFRGHQVTGKITYYAGRTGDWLVTFDKDCWDKVGINAWYFQLDLLEKHFVLEAQDNSLYDVGDIVVFDRRGNSDGILVGVIQEFEEGEPAYVIRLFNERAAYQVAYEDVIERIASVGDPDWIILMHRGEIPHDEIANYAGLPVSEVDSIIDQELEKYLTRTSKVSLSSVIKKVAMNINKDDLHTLWYEDENGNKYTQVQFDGSMPPDLPKGYKYQISQFPNMLRTTALTTIAQEDVDACSHPEEYVARTGGWIDSVKGRECKLCGGSQTVDIADYPEDIWPEDWDAGNSQVAYAFESSWPEDLALAMATSGDYTLGEAILIAGNNCERCMNALAHKYGLDWGYPEYSEEWQLTGTECDFCRGEKMGKTARIPFAGIPELENLYRTLEVFDEEFGIALTKIQDGAERVYGDRLPALSGEVEDIIEFFEFRQSLGPFYKLVNEIENEVYRQEDYEEERREMREEGLISSMILVAQEEKSICVDFDGTLVQYDGFKGEGVFGDVLEGAKEVLKALSEDGWLIIIFTCRGEEDLIADFLTENEVPFDHINRRPDMHPNQNQGKPHAQYYVDDRAIEFKGNWPEIYQRVTGQPWKERRDISESGEFFGKEIAPGAYALILPEGIKVKEKRAMEISQRLKEVIRILGQYIRRPGEPGQPGIPPEDSEEWLGMPYPEEGPLSIDELHKELQKDLKDAGIDSVIKPTYVDIRGLKSTSPGSTRIWYDMESDTVSINSDFDREHNKFISKILISTGWVPDYRISRPRVGPPQSRGPG